MGCGFWWGNSWCVCAYRLGEGVRIWWPLGGSTLDSTVSCRPVGYRDGRAAIRMDRLTEQPAII